MPTKKIKLRKISHTDKWMVKALLHLTSIKLNELKEQEALIAKTLSVVDDGQGYFGHVSDVVYNQGTAEELFRRLDIK